MENLKTEDSVGAGLVMRSLIGDVLNAKGKFTVECIGADGKMKWKDTIENLVTTVGKNDLLDKYLGTGAFTPTIRMGLKGSGTAVIADTQASHASWLEVGGTNLPTYTGTRQTPTFSAAAAGAKATSAAVSFAITGSGSVFGCFINNGGAAAKDDTTGVLFSAGDFTGGSRAVVNLDTLNVTYSLSV
jgi:hypothetical protein